MRTTANQRRLGAAWKKSQREKGLCRECSEPVQQGHGLCPAHMEKRRKWTRERQARKKRDGICLKCSAPAAEGLTHCERHRQIVNAKMRPQTIERRFEDARYFAVRRFRKRKEIAVAWALTMEEYSAIQGLPCHYCDCNFVLPRGSGLDRIRNDVGYAAGNVVPCCEVCNRSRGDHITYENMRRFIGPAVKAMKIADAEIDAYEIEEEETDYLDLETVGPPGQDCTRRPWL